MKFNEGFCDACTQENYEDLNLAVKPVFWGTNIIKKFALWQLYKKLGVFASIGLLQQLVT